MEGLPEIDMIKLSGILFKFVGESKPSPSRALHCFRIFNAATMATALWFAFVNFFFVKGEMYVQALQSTILFAHALLKYLSFINCKANIRELLNEIVTRFWKHGRFNRNVAQEIERIHRTVERLQRVMLTVTGFGVVMYMMKPFLAANRGLLLESYVPHSAVVDAILLFSQFHCFFYSVPFVLGYDFVYFALCAHITLQFRLLKHKIRQALSKHDEKTISRLKVCVRHHQLLFTIRQRMQNIYSITLLFHYIGTLISTCVVLLELFLRRTNFMNYAAKVLTIPVFMVQFALYAFPAEQVASEFTALSDAIYASFWYKNNVSNQKMLLFIMTAAQRVHYFSGAGLVDINVDAFESVSDLLYHVPFYKHSMKIILGV
ncbi:hypothetical protein Trydic_g17489 [Trypoxylus dichotomus]